MGVESAGAGGSGGWGLAHLQSLLGCCTLIEMVEDILSKYCLSIPAKINTLGVQVTIIYVAVTNRTPPMFNCCVRLAVTILALKVGISYPSDVNLWASNIVGILALSLAVSPWRYMIPIFYGYLHLSLMDLSETYTRCLYSYLGLFYRTPIVNCFIFRTEKFNFNVGTIPLLYGQDQIL